MKDPEMRNLSQIVQVGPMLLIRVHIRRRQVGQSQRREVLMDAEAVRVAMVADSGGSGL